MRVSLLIALALLLSVGRAEAARIPCGQVRHYVALYGENMVLSWARGQGYDARTIARARRCLK
jgi:hypothetical protein